LSRESTKTLVAVLREDPFVILGYLVVELPEEGWQVIHFSYVKKAWRGIGIFKQMIEESELDRSKRIEFTHHMGKPVPENFIYNPYLV
jgi:hypothetical protein